MGWAAVYGFEPLTYLRTRDPVERLAIELGIESAHRKTKDLQQQQAYLLARATWGDGKNG